MSKFQSKAHRATTAIAAAAVLAAGLLTATSSMANAFDNKMQSVISQVKADPNYKSIPLATAADREWFFNECEALYKNKITKEQYMADGAKQFPGYDASFAEVADLLTKA